MPAVPSWLVVPLVPVGLSGVRPPRIASIASRCLRAPDALDSVVVLDVCDGAGACVVSRSGWLGAEEPLVPVGAGELVDAPLVPTACVGAVAAADAALLVTELGAALVLPAAVVLLGIVAAAGASDCAFAPGVDAPPAAFSNSRR